MERQNQLGSSRISAVTAFITLNNGNGRLAAPFAASMNTIYCRGKFQETWFIISRMRTTVV